MNDLQKPVAEKRPLTSEQVFDLYHEGNKDAIRYLLELFVT